MVHWGISPLSPTTIAPFTFAQQAAQAVSDAAKGFQKDAEWTSSHWRRANTCRDEPLRCNVGEIVGDIGDWLPLGDSWREPGREPGAMRVTRAKICSRKLA
jgi:hypothetical protein